MERNEILEKLLESEEFHDRAHDIVTVICGPKGEPAPATEAMPSDPGADPTKG